MGAVISPPVNGMKTPRRVVGLEVRPRIISGCHLGPESCDQTTRRWYPLGRNALNERTGGFGAIEHVRESLGCDVFRAPRQAKRKVG